MKRAYRLTLYLLLFSLLIGAFALFAPASYAAADEKTAYDKLYVGSNGAPTENGGSLTALYTAFLPNDPSVDLYEGTWYDKVGNRDAQILGGEKSAANPAGWTLLKDGGLSYSDPDFSGGYNKFLSLPNILLDKDFEVEAVAAVKLRDIPTPAEAITVPPPSASTGGRMLYQFKSPSAWQSSVTATVTVKTEAGKTFTPYVGYSKTDYVEPTAAGAAVTADADGKATFTFSYYGSFVSLALPAGVTVSELRLPKVTANSEACSPSSFVFGALRMMTWTSLSGSNSYKNGFGLTRYYISGSAWNSTAVEYRDKNTFSSLNNIVSTLSVARSRGAYTVIHGGTVAFTSNESKVAEYPAGTGFSLFANLPSDVYAVRVYNKPLTESERQRNHLVDLLAYASFPIEDYTALDVKAQRLLAEQVSTLSISDGAQRITVTLGDLIEGLSAESVSKESLLYAQDGLVAVFTSYASLSSVYVPSVTGVKWSSLLDLETSIELRGSGWSKNASGGFSIERTKAEWDKDNNFGIKLDYSLLPENDYTVELTVNPFGIHETQADGSKTRYVDTVSQYGTYKDYGFVLGPLRAMTFASIRDNGKDGQLDKRWIYLSSGGWDRWCGYYKRTQLFTDSWASVATDEAVSYAITLDESKNASGIYRFYNNGHEGGRLTLPYEEVPYIDRRDTSEKRFELFNHVPGTVYAVRIYNRTLNEAELTQNRAADLIYYHGIDTSLLNVLLSLGVDAEELYSALTVLDFSMTKEEAQAKADSVLSAFLLRYGGVGMRQDVSEYDAIRYYFDIDMGLLALLEQNGYTVTLGASATVGDGEAKLLTAYNGEKNGFFTDADTFAVTVKYNHLGSSDSTFFRTPLSVCGYITLTKGASALTYYTEARDKDGYLIDGIGAVCRAVNGKSSDEALSARIEALLSLCCENIAFEVGEGAYTLSEALSLAESAMKNATVPTRVTVRLKEGEHSLSSTITLSGKDFNNPFTELLIEGAGEGAAITSLKDIDTGGFESIGGNLYRYRFARGANGKYPAFRYLYVDGKMASLASAGALRAASGEQSLIAFDYTADGKFYLPAEVVEPLRALLSGANDPRTALVGKDVMMHVVCQWDYNMLHVEGVDFDDCKEADGKKHYAVYTNRQEFASFCIPKNNSIKKRPVYLTGSAAFLNEEGEFHYDPQTGTLLYYSGGDISGLRFSYPMLDTLLLLEDIGATTLKNLTFTGTDDYFLSENGHTGGQSSGDPRFNDFPNRAAVKILGSKGLTVMDCAFVSLPCEGITGRGRLEGITVSGCYFEGIGSSALRLGDRSNAWDDKHGLCDVLVTNNIFTDIAYIYRASAALHFASAKNLSVVGNTIRGCSYSAISAGWHWSAVSWSESAAGEAPSVNLYNVEISRNYISDYMTEMADGGAIYVLGGNVGREAEGHVNKMEGNFIVFTEKTGNGLGGMVCGIYLDACSSHWHLLQNVIVEQSAAADISGTVAQRRRSGSFYIYLQHRGVNAPTYRVLCEANMILGVRAAEGASHSSGIPLQEYEVFRTYVDETNFVYAKDTEYITRVSSLPSHIVSAIAAAGAGSDRGSEELLYGNDY